MWFLTLSRKKLFHYYFHSCLIKCKLSPFPSAFTPASTTGVESCLIWRWTQWLALRGEDALRWAVRSAGGRATTSACGGGPLGASLSSWLHCGLMCLGFRQWLCGQRRRRPLWERPAAQFGHRRRGDALAFGCLDKTNAWPLRLGWEVQDAGLRATDVQRETIALWASEKQLVWNGTLKGGGLSLSLQLDGERPLERRGVATEQQKLWLAGMEPHFLLLWPKLSAMWCGTDGAEPGAVSSSPHPPPFTSQSDGEEALKVAVQTLLLSGTKCIYSPASRWSKLPAAISVSSRLLHWQNQGPEGRHRSQRQGLPGGWDSEWGEQAATVCKSRCRKEDKQTSEADFLYSWILLRPSPGD